MSKIEELVGRLRAGEVSASLNNEAADALEAAARVMGPFAAMATEVEAWKAGRNPIFPGHFNEADLVAARNWLQKGE